MTGDEHRLARVLAAPVGHHTDRLSGRDARFDQRPQEPVLPVCERLGQLLQDVGDVAVLVEADHVAVEPAGVDELVLVGPPLEP